MWAKKALPMFALIILSIGLGVLIGIRVARFTITLSSRASLVVGSEQLESRMWTDALLNSCGAVAGVSNEYDAYYLMGRVVRDMDTRVVAESLFREALALAEKSTSMPNTTKFVLQQITRDLEALDEQMVR